VCVCASEFERESARARERERERERVGREGEGMEREREREAGREQEGSETGSVSTYRKSSLLVFLPFFCIHCANRLQHCNTAGISTLSTHS
jgi:hypothetical protein